MRSNSRQAWVWFYLLFIGLLLIYYLCDFIYYFIIFIFFPTSFGLFYGMTLTLFAQYLLLRFWGPWILPIWDYLRPHKIMYHFIDSDITSFIIKMWCYAKCFKTQQHPVTKKFWPSLQPQNIHRYHKSSKFTTDNFKKIFSFIKKIVISSILSWNYELKWNVRKSLVICASQLAGAVLLKKLKCFKDMLNIFEFSRVWEIAESWLVYANKFSWIAQ